MKASQFNVWAERDGDSFVYNGVSGSMLRLAGEDRQAFQRMTEGQTGTMELASETLTKLAVGRMVVADDLDEVALLGDRYARSRESRSEFGLTIVTSLGCNFDCPYCFEAKHPSILNADVQDRVFALLDAQLPQIHTMRVTWFGGEPLVGKDALLRLSDGFIDRCDRAEVAYAAMIVTNGYLLSEATCRQLQERRVMAAQVCLDGPPDVHDRMRPLVGGHPSFGKIVENLHHAVDFLDVTVRMNIDRGNADRAEELMQILAAEGLAGKLRMVAGQIVGIDDGAPAPSSTYSVGCFTSPQFAEEELEFLRLAGTYGFAEPTLPNPLGTPCTAVRANELVIGSRGELYKCWESVGNPLEVVGHIKDLQASDSRLAKWLEHDPFADAECRTCVALPVCMGGCAHHAMAEAQYENRCDSFRFTYQQQVDDFINHARDGQVFIPAAQLTHRMDGR